MIPILANLGVIPVRLGDSYGQMVSDPSGQTRVKSVGCCVRAAHVLCVPLADYKDLKLTQTRLG